LRLSFHEEKKGQEKTPNSDPGEAKTIGGRMEHLFFENEGDSKN